MRKRDIIALVRWFITGLAEIVTLITFMIGVYFFLCLIAK